MINVKGKDSIINYNMQQLLFARYNGVFTSSKNGINTNFFFIEYNSYILNGYYSYKKT